MAQVITGVLARSRGPACERRHDEGTDDGGVAPLLGGWLMVEVSMAPVFHVGGAFALTGAGTMLAVLLSRHGTAGLREW